MSDAELWKQFKAVEAAKDGAYLERNKLVAFVAKTAIELGWSAGTARTAIEGWSDDWHGCVYVDLPTGQLSWHYHDTQAWLFASLPPYTGVWDGHDTPEKYRRLLSCVGIPDQEYPRQPGSQSPTDAAVGTGRDVLDGGTGR